MARKEYRVDYHLICAMHFAVEVPSGQDLALLWAGLAALGDRPAEISYVCRGDNEITALENSTVGSASLSDVFVNKADHLASAGAASVRPDAHNSILDSDVNFTFNRSRLDGQEELALLTVSISGQVIEQVGSKEITQVVRQLFEVADSRSPVCGLVDLARPYDAYAGMVYGSAWPRTAPLARWVEHLNWLSSGAVRGDRLRGIHWGNYLGSKVLDRLGGADTFLQTCARNARNYDGTANAHCWGLANGLFVSLCIDPLDCRPNSPIGLHPAAEANLKWLVRELGPTGVLNYW